MQKLKIVEREIIGANTPCVNCVLEIHLDFRLHTRTQLI